MMRLTLSLLSFFILVLLSGTYGNLCHPGKTCGSCIGLSSECSWCADRNYHVTNNERCDSWKQLELGGCRNKISPSGNLELTKNVPVRNGDSGAEAVQLQPQGVRIRLRPHEPHTFGLTFRLAENYPVDLYYLMDLSSSMKDDKANIENVALEIGRSMSNITRNFRLGFGAFVDKVTSPYVDLSNSGHLYIPDGMIRPYSFKHYMNLNADAEVFKSSVVRAKLATNADEPESGLDAMAQAIICKDRIGWRTQSRKFLLYASDAHFKMAGDGKLAGIMKPNDGHCHLNSNGDYTEAENQDYPSVGQIADIVRENNINCIFAIISNSIGMYEALSKRLPGSETTELRDGSTNIVSIIQENYKRITSKLELKVQAPDYVKVQFTSSCTSGPTEETHICEGVKIGKSLTFNVTVTLLQCPTDVAKHSHSFSIYPVGLSEKVDVQLNPICECSCKTSEEVPGATECQGNGTLDCGLCVCPKDRYGPLCECEGSSVLDTTGNCTDSTISGQPVCSGRGNCICGACQCFSTGSNAEVRYSGQFCECDDTTCSEGNKTCNDHGRCECGKCICETGYKGELCDCSTEQDRCLTASGKICSERGACECNKCKCSTDVKYHSYGSKCEECPLCPGKCGEYLKCVLCRGFSTYNNKLTHSKEECEQKCPNVTIVDTVNKEGEKATFCEKEYSGDECRYAFSYTVDEGDNVILKASKPKDCPISDLVIVVGVIGGIIGLGILLLILAKLLIIYMNKLEYSRFERDAQKAAWGTPEISKQAPGQSRDEQIQSISPDSEKTDNPLYKPAESHFVNPAFQGD